LSEECTAYLVDTNVIISAVIRGEVPRRCLETCPVRYLVPEPVIEELLELPTTEDFQDIVARIERSLSKGKISIEELLAREVKLVATLLKSNLEYIRCETIVRQETWLCISKDWVHNKETS